jgi:diguanylate cyclase (GGDEF)-like protein/PAS domain S-box-containing protein
MRIRSRLYVHAAAGAAAFLLASALAIYAAYHAESRLSAVYAQRVAPTVALVEMRTALNGIHMRMAGYLLDQMPAVGSRIHLREARDLIPKTWARFKEGGRDRVFSAEERALIETVDRNIATVEPFFDKLDRAYSEDDKAAITPLLEDEWPYAVQATLLKPADKLIPLQRAAVQAAYEESEAFSHTIVITVVVFFGVTALGLGILHVRLVLGITRPLSAAVAVANRVAAGDWGDAIDAGKQDELGELLDAIDHMRNEVRTRQERIATILDNAAEGIIVFDKQGVIESFNQAAERLFGYTEEQIRGQDIALLIPPPATGERRKEYLEHLMRTQIEGLIGHEGEVSARHKSGETFPIALKISKMSLQGKEMYTVLAADIRERKALIEDLRRLAEHDGLTGLYNRTYFLGELERVVDRARRTTQGCAVFYIDLDNFKNVNDTLGHAAGDRLLMEVASVLGRRARKSDLLARLGGDEFTVLLYNIMGEQAKAVAESFRQSLADYRFKQGEKIVDIGCSIGLTLITHQTESASQALMQADIACHHAKHGGRNRVHVFEAPDAENLTALAHDMGWAQRIKEALADDRFMLVFQPIVITKTGIVDCYEVLLRLRDEQENLIMPSAFLPAAERFGLAADIDKWVVAHSLAILAKKREEQPELRFAINLTRTSLADVGMCELIERRITENGLNPSALIVEVAESAVIADLAAADTFLSKIRAMGCGARLDNFGSGLSSLTYLHNLPVDCVKIDGRFVKNIADNTVDRAMVGAMSDVVRAMGMRTVAGCVENAGCLRVLSELGVDLAQGYHLGRPQSEITHEKAKT